MRVRVGLVRGLIAVLGMLLLVIPVGVDTPSGPQPAAVGVVLSDLASGKLGVGILSALVEGGALASAALWRMGLAAAAWLAWWLAGGIRVTRVADEPPSRKRRRCPYCEEWLSPAMTECPACGRAVRSA